MHWLLRHYYLWVTKCIQVCLRVNLCICMQVSKEGRRCWIFWSCRDRQVWATWWCGCWKPNSGRAASGLHLWASLQPLDIFISIHKYLCVCMSERHMCADAPGAREGVGSLRCNYRRLWSTSHGWTELRPLGRAASALHHWVVSPAPQWRYFFSLSARYF